MEGDELAEWLESVDDVVYRHGPETWQRLMQTLQDRTAWHGIELSTVLRTPYLNSISARDQPAYPGKLDLERQIENLIRWNAMAVVVRANRDYPGIGGHLSSFASICTLFEVGFHHFFRAPTSKQLGDLVYFHGHSSPGFYARAFVEGRLNAETMKRFRRETPRETGLSSYPHPWLMPEFWQFPTVSMGLGPIQAIYQARFLRYLQNRNILKTSDSRVWCFAGDGEMDEPESTASLSLAVREKLDNLILVVNCNLQRLDGPVRGNGKIIQELESLFRGAGWNCLKVIWGGGWDSLIEEDDEGVLLQRMNDVDDGQMQKYCVESPEYFREDFFGHSPELERIAEGLSDEDLSKLIRDRGGHDSQKIHAAYQAATEHRGSPTVILAQTIKGYGLGSAGEAHNVTHKTKTLEEEELLRFRDRFEISLNDEDARALEFVQPEDDGEAAKYLHERRETLGGFLPARNDSFESLEIPPLDTFKTLLEESDGSTTLNFGKMLSALLKDEAIGERIVPIIPDEARTFGLESFFGHAGIYTSQGQQYEPVDADKLIHYRESEEGQLLEEGITEAGAMSSFIAAGSSYANLGNTTIPFYLFYSMFGFQRVGDLIWAAADARARGFLLGCTAGRTTLNGEGLQHQDGHSHLVGSTIPTLRCYDPAFAYEVAVIVQDGLHRMYQNNEDLFYYLTLYNEGYEMPAMGEELSEGILRGAYRFSSKEVENDDSPGRPQLFGSGTILKQAEAAQEILAEKFGIATDLWSVTSYSELRRDALQTERWNNLHPEEEPQTSYLQRIFFDVEGPFIAATDFMKAVPDQISRWIPGAYCVLGTDGFGRSDTRPALRRYFEVDAEHIAYTTLSVLAKQDRYDRERLADAIQTLELDPEKLDPAVS